MLLIIHLMFIAVETESIEVTIGTVVDIVTEVSRVPTTSIEPSSSVITTSDSEYPAGIVGTDEKLIILLDIARSSVN